MNPFEDGSFLKDIKRCFIIKQMIKENKKYDLSESNIKIHNNVISISIKINGDSNVYKYQYIPKQKQIIKNIKNKTKITDDMSIDCLDKNFEKMVID